MDKFFKNPKYMGIISVLTLVLLIALLWDDKKNPDKDFFGLLKSNSATPVA